MTEEETHERNTKFLTALHDLMAAYGVDSIVPLTRWKEEAETTGDRIDLFLRGSDTRWAYGPLGDRKDLEVCSLDREWLAYNILGDDLHRGVQYVGDCEDPLGERKGP